MALIRRVFLFIITNLAVLLLISIILSVLSIVFGINLTGYGAGLGTILAFAAVVGFTGSFISLWMSKGIAKRAYRIQLISPQDSLSSKESLVYRVVSEIAEKHRITLPEVGVYQSASPNAFATGPTKNRSLVAVSSGLLDDMNESAIEGVVAHEMAHVLNGDMVTMALLQGVMNTFVIFASRVIANIADSFFGNNESDGPSWVYYVTSIGFDLLFGVFASMILMAYSRRREYRADEGSATFVGKQKMLAALEALQRLNALAPTSKAKLATSMITTNDKNDGLKTLFMSHPPLTKRIENVENFQVA